MVIGTATGEIVKYDLPSSNYSVFVGSDRTLVTGLGGIYPTENIAVNLSNPDDYKIKINPQESLLDMDKFAVVLNYGSYNFISNLNRILDTSRFKVQTRSEIEGVSGSFSVKIYNITDPYDIRVFPSSESLEQISESNIIEGSGETYLGNSNNKNGYGTLFEFSETGLSPFVSFHFIGWDTGRNTPFIYAENQIDEITT